jgi:hypothetical protein
VPNFVSGLFYGKKFLEHYGLEHFGLEQSEWNSLGFTLSRGEFYARAATELQ